jgi:hypothetical protein
LNRPALPDYSADAIVAQDRGREMLGANFAVP